MLAHCSRRLGKVWLVYLFLALQIWRPDFLQLLFQGRRRHIHSEEAGYESNSREKSSLDLERSAQRQGTQSQVPEILKIPCYR